MAPLPKRRHSTYRGGKRWNAFINRFKKSLKNLNLKGNKHLRILSSN